MFFIRNLIKSFSNSTYSEKYKAFEFDNHLLRRINISQAYFKPTVQSSVSLSEPGLRFQYVYEKNMYMLINVMLLKKRA